MFLPNIKLALAKEKVMYCHFEGTVYSPVPLSRCTNMKVVSKQMGLINFSQFDSLNTSYECSDNFDIINPCTATHMYYSYYPLNYFSEDDIVGDVCLQHYVKYNTNETMFIDMYESISMQERVYSITELEKLFEECGRVI